MSAIYTDDVRHFFRDNYRCEVLTSTEKNKQLIEKFHAMDKGKNLEAYLKQRAWSEDAEGETRVYFIKDNNGEVPLFFSLKCGLLYKPYDYTRLEDSQQQDFVNMMLDALETHNEQLIEDYISSGFYSYEESKRLLKIAKKQYEVKCEGKRMQDDSFAYKVDECYSGIELCHLCKNIHYKPPIEYKIPIGFCLFWEKIVPKVLEISELIGCRYLYLFAADQSNSKEEKNLVQYYKNDLKFGEIQNMMIIKPRYDQFCEGLIQPVRELKENREMIWESFSDVFSF